jgi:hypothetical protein
MVDVDTFLTALYVMVDDFCHSRSQTEQHPGPDASLSPSEVITLAVFSRWSRFGSERDFYRYASSRLRDAFPTLPHRSQFNRSVRNHLDLIEEVALHLAKVMKAQRYPYEALDSSAMPIRDAKRRGEGWLAGFADIGWSNSLGWYEGFRLLVATDPTGVITGFGFCAASATDQQVALRPSSLCGIDRTLGYRAWDQRPWDPTLPTRALRAKKTIGAGWNATGCASSTRPSATAASGAGPSA